MHRSDSNPAIERLSRRFFFISNRSISMYRIQLDHWLYCHRSRQVSDFACPISSASRLIALHLLSSKLQEILVNNPNVRIGALIKFMVMLYGLQTELHRCTDHTTVLIRRIKFGNLFELKFGAIILPFLLRIMAVLRSADAS